MSCVLCSAFVDLLCNLCKAFKGKMSNSDTLIANLPKKQCLYIFFGQLFPIFDKKPKI